MGYVYLYLNLETVRALGSMYRAKTFLGCEDKHYSRTELFFYLKKFACEHF